MVARDEDDVDAFPFVIENVQVAEAVEDVEFSGPRPLGDAEVGGFGVLPLLNIFKSSGGGRVYCFLRSYGRGGMGGGVGLRGIGGGVGPYPFV